MSEDLERPAKRARFDEPEGDAPGSPVDDMDDDFYDTPPAKPSPLSMDAEGALLSSSGHAFAPSSPSALQLPGLGLLSHPPQQDTSAQVTQIIDDDLEDGELSDSVSLYDHAKPAEAGLDAALQSELGAVTAAPMHVLGASGDNMALSNEAILSGRPSLRMTSVPLANLQSAGQSHLRQASTKIENDESTVEPLAGDNTVDEPVVDDAEAQFLRAGTENKGRKEAEWEIDSEGSNSSSNSSSDNSSSDSDDEAGSDEGELLDPEEQVRRLMMEALDESSASVTAKVKTLNEVAEEYKKPDIQITNETKITQLGEVESVVDNLVLIKANTSGDYQVLEADSALCLGDRTVIGKVAETIGRVQDPRYTIGFSDPSEIETLAITKGTLVYYIDEHSKFVYTEPLKGLKGTDASNLYDEEANEVEFSDDEKEAEHKRKQKEAKKAKTEANRDPLEGAPRMPASDRPAASHPGQYQGGGLNYGSDDDEDLGMYKPLARPDHFEHLVGAGAPIEDRSHVRRGNMRGRGGWPDRGRGFRGRGGGGDRGGRGGRGGGGSGHEGGRGGNVQRGNQRGDHRGSRVPTGPANPQERHDMPQERGRGKRFKQNQRRKEDRAAASASPNRQKQGRHQPQRSPSRGNPPARRQQRFGSSPLPDAQPPAPNNSSSYAQNSNLSNVWPIPTSSSALQPAYGYSAASQPAIPQGAYVNPAFYGQQAGTQAQQQQHQHQQNIAQWAQWFQLAAAMSQNQGQSQPSPAPAPTSNVNPQPSNTQNENPSLQDILRTLGGSQNR